MEAASVNLAGASALVRVHGGADVAALATAVDKISCNHSSCRRSHACRDMVEHYHEDEKVQWRRFWVAAALTFPAVARHARPGHQWSRLAQGAVTPWCSGVAGSSIESRSVRLST